jgi:hypothetical protein
MTTNSRSNTTIGTPRKLEVKLSGGKGGVDVTALASACHGITIKITINLLGATRFADMLRGCTVHLADGLST